MAIILLKTKSSSPTEVVSFLILMTFKIKVFGSHHFKLVVFQSYTEFGFMNIVYFDESYITEVQEHITN